MLNLVREGDDLRGRFKFCGKGRQKLHQLRGLIAVAADHCLQRVKRVKQEMRIHLSVQELNF